MVLEASHLVKKPRWAIIYVSRGGRLPLEFLFEDRLFMANPDAIEVEADVIQALPNTMFRLEFDHEGKKHQVLGHISGRLRKHFIRILPGDRVRVELSPYDLTRGRITRRL